METRSAVRGGSYTSCERVRGSANMLWGQGGASIGCGGATPTQHHHLSTMDDSRSLSPGGYMIAGAIRPEDHAGCRGYSRTGRRGIVRRATEEVLLALDNSRSEPPARLSSSPSVISSWVISNPAVCVARDALLVQPRRRVCCARMFCSASPRCLPLSKRVNCSGRAKHLLPRHIVFRGREENWRL